MISFDFPKYVLLTHPMMSEKFILRTKEPIVLGQIVIGNIEDLIRQYQPIAVGKVYECNEWAVFFSGILSPYKFEGTGQQQADALARIMRKMSDFYFYNYYKKGKT